MLGGNRGSNGNGSIGPGDFRGQSDSTMNLTLLPWLPFLQLYLLLVGVASEIGQGLEKAFLPTEDPIINNQFT